MALEWLTDLMLSFAYARSNTLANIPRYPYTFESHAPQRTQENHLVHW